MINNGVKIKNLFAVGDFNAFVGLIADNMANLSLAIVMLSIFKIPMKIIFFNMLPGMITIVFLGNIVMTLLSIYLAKKHNHPTITAMPYGLDAPTTITIPLIIIGPIYLSLRNNGVDVYTAGIMAWQAGMAATAIIGLIKIAMTPIANFLSKGVPRAGLLGSLAGIGMMIGIFSLIEIFSLPLIGIISLGFVLYLLIAHLPFSNKLPGLLLGIIICTIIYHLAGYAGILTTTYTTPSFNISLTYPKINIGFINGFKTVLPMLPAIIPFAILTSIGDINCTVSAIDKGDPYSPKSILLIDGLITFIGALFGSITQTTAYAGQPAYKNMGAKVGYALYIGIFMAITGYVGIIHFIIKLIHTAIFAPILMFVALEIVAQGFSSVPPKHYVASAFAMFPSAIKPMFISLTGGTYVSITKLIELSGKISSVYPNILVLAALINGFILTGMLWGGLLAELIDRRLKTASIYLFLLSIFSFFGIVHSVDLSGTTYLPWHLSAINRSLCYHISIGYLILGILMLISSFIVGEQKLQIRSGIIHNNRK